MDKSKRSTDKEKGGVNSGDRSRSSSEKDPRNHEGYTKGEEASSSSPKRDHFYGAHDLSSDPDHQLLAKIQGPKEKSYAEQFKEQQEAFRRKSELNDMIRTVRATDESIESYYNQLANMNKERKWAKSVEDQLKGAEIPKEQARSESKSEAEDYYVSDSDVSQPEFDED